MSSIRSIRSNQRNNVTIYTRLVVTWFVLMYIKTLSVHAVQLPKRSYTPSNVSPNMDLLQVSLPEASMITQTWYAKVTQSVKCIRKEDEHIVTQINRFETSIQKEIEEERIFYIWTPPEQNGHCDVLFVVMITLHLSRNEMVVDLVVQSPFWSSEQIDSIHLRTCIESKVRVRETHLKLNMEPLFVNDPRYRLEWSSR